MQKKLKISLNFSILVLDMIEHKINIGNDFVEAI